MDGGRRALATVAGNARGDYDRSAAMHPQCILQTNRTEALDRSLGSRIAVILMKYTARVLEILLDGLPRHRERVPVLQCFGAPIPPPPNCLASCYSVE